MKMVVNFMQNSSPSPIFISFLILGLQQPRSQSVSGNPLPSARRISQFIHQEQNVEMKSITLMLMQWGQFIDHDVTSTVKSRSFNGTVPRCCYQGGQSMLSPELTVCLKLFSWLNIEWNLNYYFFIGERMHK